jgi:hypothetical protein
MSRRAPKKIRSLKDLMPDQHNANRGNERGKGMIQNSIRVYGAGRSVLCDRNGKLIAGIGNSVPPLFMRAIATHVRRNILHG